MSYFFKFILLLLCLSFPIALLAQLSYAPAPVETYDRYASQINPSVEFRNYYFIIEDETGVTPKSCHLVINGLPGPGPKTYQIDIKRLFFNQATVSTFLVTTNAAGTMAMTSSPVSLSFGEGIYQLVVSDTTPGGYSQTIPYNFIVLEKVRNITIPSAPYGFKIHYIESFFQYHPLATNVSTFLNYLENTLRESWRIEVEEWDLCDGINKLGCVNIPVNSTENYNIFIHNLKDIPTSHPTGFQYHQGNDIRADLTSENQRGIHIDARTWDYLGAHSGIITEQELIYSVIAHEFYHGIQASHVVYDSTGIIIPSGSNLSAEINKMKWLIEGQAKALETVFMAQKDNTNQPLSTTGTNVIYNQNTNSVSYEYFCNYFLTHSLGNATNFESLHDQSYAYAMFWRFLYEHSYLTGSTPTVADRLNIFRESCKQNTTSNLLDIKNFMDSELSASTEVYSSFSDALTDFSEKVYFHDTVWKNPDGTLINNWDDPNANNFYTAVSGYTPPADVVIPASNVVPVIISKIDKSFAFKSHVYKFSAKGGFTVNFNSDADGDNIKATLHAQAFIIENDLIRYKKDFVLTNGVGSLNEICITNINQKLVILVTRLDPDEATISEDYKISGTLHANPVAAFTASIDYGTSPLTVAFADQSTNYPVNWAWDLGDGTSSTLQNPKHEYIKSGKQNVKLIIDNCITTSTLQKNNFISVLPPYIETVEFIQDEHKIYRYKRSYNSATQKFEFSDSGSYAVKTKALTINVKTSLPLVHLKLVIEDEKNAEVYSKDLLKSPNADTKNWSYTIPANSVKIGMGINILSFSGEDYNSKALINTKTPASVPVYINSSGGNTFQPAVATGIDNNYILYMDNSASGVDPVTYILLNECDEYRVILANNKYPTCTVDFGDGTPTKTLSIRSVADHTYSQSHPAFQIKIYANGENVKIINGRFVK